MLDPTREDAINYAARALDVAGPVQQKIFGGNFARLFS